MKCEVCGKENLENEEICVKCGNPLLKDKKTRNIKKINKLFGFKNNSIIKKIIAIIYYFYIIIISIGIFSVMKDMNLESNLIYIFILLIINSLWIIFSDFEFSKKIRKQKNLAKGNILNNIIFYIKFIIIYFIIFLSLSFICYRG